MIRLIDKSNGQMLQCYSGHTNNDYRIRSCLGLGDALVISGSEDGKVYVWNALKGTLVVALSAHGGKVASAVTSTSARREFASAGVDGRRCTSKYSRVIVLTLDRFCRCLGLPIVTSTARCF